LNIVTSIDKTTSAEPRPVFERVAYNTPPYLRLLGCDIAKSLKMRFGSRVHCFQSTQENVNFFGRHGKGGFDAIQDAAVLYKAVRSGRPPDSDAIGRRARAHEERLGITYNLLVMGDRHLGRGFSPLGFHHPRSKLSQLPDYLGVIHAVSEQIEFWEREFDAHDFSLALDPSKIMAVVARHRAVPIRVLVGSRIRNLHMWADNEYWDCARLARRYADIAEAAPMPLAAPYTKSLKDRADALQRYRLSRALKTITHMALQRAYWHWRGYEKAQGYYLTDNIRYVLNEWRATRQELKGERIRLKDLDGQRFVFFALHEEPETALTIGSPEYLSQFAAILSIARDLPADVICVVKDVVYALGRRPREFYAQLQEFKNVRLMHVAEHGLEIAQRADAVVAIAGTVGFEAAISGVPVISLGRHNPYHFLPHVASPRSEEEFGAALRWALSPAIDREQAKRDGARFAQAIIEESVDFGPHRYEAMEHFPPALIDSLIDSLEESFA